MASEEDVLIEMLRDALGALTAATLIAGWEDHPNRGYQRVIEEAKRALRVAEEYCERKE